MTGKLMVTDLSWLGPLVPTGLLCKISIDDGNLLATWSLAELMRPVGL